MHGRPCHLRFARIPGQSFAILASVALVASACTSGPHELPPRSKLNRYELQSIAPEIRQHSDCLAREIGPGERGMPVLSTRARSRCEPTLALLRARLRAFNLSEAAQRQYLGALEIASRSQASRRAGSVPPGAGLE